MGKPSLLPFASYEGDGLIAIGSSEGGSAVLQVEGETLKPLIEHAGE